MKKVNLLLIFLLFSSVAAVAQEEKFGINLEVFNKELPQTITFLKYLPPGSVVLTWIDGGLAIEGLTPLKSVSIYPSQKLLDMGAFPFNYSGPTETDEKVKDISTFFATSDENTALSIAKKYNVKYVLVTDDMIGKQQWMQALAKGCIASECPSYLFNAAYNDLNPEQVREELQGSGAEFFEIGWNYRYIIVPSNLKDTLLTKMFFKSYSLANFKKIYSDERSKVFEVTEKADSTNQILAILLVVGIIATGIYLWTHRVRATLNAVSEKKKKQVSIMSKIISNGILGTERSVIPQRVLALIIDYILLVLLFYFFYAGRIYVGPFLFNFSLEALHGIILAIVVSLLLAYVSIIPYKIVLESWKGQSIGKMIMKIIVVKEDGRPCGIKAALVRNILLIIDGFFYYAIGLLFIALSERKQRLGDRLAHTVVVSCK